MDSRWRRGTLAQRAGKRDYGPLFGGGKALPRDAQHEDDGKLQSFSRVHRHHLHGSRSVRGFRRLDLASSFEKIGEIIYELMQWRAGVFILARERRHAARFVLLLPFLQKLS